MNAARQHPTTKRPTRPIHTLHTVTLGITRCAVGALILTHATATLRLAGTDQNTAARLAWTARLAAIRDLALGAGLLTALATHHDTHTWLTAGMLADAGDVSVFATATARGHLPPALGTAMTLAALGGVAAAAPLTLRHTTPDTGE